MTKAKTTLATRRALLQGATAVAILAPAATIGAAAIASMPDPLIALCDKWRAADTEQRAALDRWNDAEDALHAARKSNDQNLRSIELAEEEAEVEKDAAGQRAWNLLEEISATAPQTVEGLFAKLRLMADEVRGAYAQDYEPDDIYEWTFLRLAEDVGRLSGGVS
jgi:hypothetical protein